MAQFFKYQHIERLGTDETEGLLIGNCFIFPKIDGTNSSVWLGDTGELCAGSRNRILSLDNDNAGFYAYIRSQQNIIDFLNMHPSFRLYGEWLVPHSLKTYEDKAWRNFYIFDVYDDVTNQYVHYDIYKDMFNEFGIDYIPAICEIRNPSEDTLYQLLEKNTFLIKDGQGTGEGIVIKRYDYVNKYGRTTWAKIVKNEFKALHSKHQTTIINNKITIEDKIVNKYITDALVEKEYSKIVNERGGWKPQYIPQLLNTVFYCLVKEDAWNFVKDFKNPTINFNTLQILTTQRIKSLMPKLF